MRRLALLAALLPAALPALAQDRPALLPSRDVAVTYRVTEGQGQGHELRMAWLVGARKLRVDAGGAPGWSVIDQRAGRMLVVMEQQRVVLEMPANTGPGGLSLPLEAPPSARFTRAGEATVAGLRCRVWHYEDGERKGETCLTADGVMLRSRGGQGNRTGAVEATQVAYGPQDPARFQAPPGYRSMPLPPGLGLPGPAPPR